MLQSLFNKLFSLQGVNSLKRDCKKDNFSVNIAKISKSPILLKIYGSEFTKNLAKVEFMKKL